MEATINDFPTIDDMTTDWDAEKRFWDQMAAADDYASYVEALALEAAEEYEREYDDDPEPPTPAAPALALVAPAYRCPLCRDTGRVLKPSAWFKGQTMEGFCPDCTPYFDFATRRFVKPAA